MPDHRCEEKETRYRFLQLFKELPRLEKSMTLIEKADYARRRTLIEGFIQDPYMAFQSFRRIKSLVHLIDLKREKTKAAPKDIGNPLRITNDELAIQFDLDFPKAPTNGVSCHFFRLPTQNPSRLRLFSRRYSDNYLNLPKVFVGDKRIQPNSHPYYDDGYSVAYPLCNESYLKGHAVVDAYYYPAFTGLQSTVSYIHPLSYLAMKSLTAGRQKPQLAETPTPIEPNQPQPWYQHWLNLAKHLIFGGSSSATTADS